MPPSSCSVTPSKSAIAPPLADDNIVIV